MGAGKRKEEGKAEGRITIPTKLSWKMTKIKNESIKIKTKQRYIRKTTFTKLHLPT